MRSVDAEQRRARLAERHRLLPRLRTDDLGRIADDLVALHSSDPVTVYLSLGARMLHPCVEAVEQALYGDRSLIRHHAMRRTLWVATPPVARRMHAAATRGLLKPELARTGKMLAAAGIADPQAWLASAFEQVLADLRKHGPSTAREIGQRVEQLRHPLRLAPDTAWSAAQSAHTRVVLLLGFAGQVLRAKPAGSWVNGAYRYAAADAWLPGGLGELDPREASAAMADHWLHRFGPASTADVRWWMGWTVATTRQALTDAAAVEVRLGDGPGWLAAGDDAEPEAEPWVAVLPSLDPTTMGWKQRDWYLPAAAAEAFDRNGNAGPTIWVDGRVVGAWAQTKTGELRTHYFEQVAAARRAEVTQRLAVLAATVGDTRFPVRFPGRIQTRLLR
jgi:hypothetical protein